MNKLIIASLVILLLAKGDASGELLSIEGGHKNTPQVTAPALSTGGNEVCMGSTSVGGSAPGVGVSFGSTWVDENCNMRRNAAMLHNMGHTKTANILLCSDTKIAAAFEASGEFKCPPAPPSAPINNSDLYR